MLSSSQLRSIKVPLFISTKEWDLPSRTYTTMWDILSSAQVSISWGSITGDISTQTDLSGLLATKAEVTHTHSPNDLTSGGALIGQVLRYNGTNWVPFTLSSTVSLSNLTQSGANLNDVISWNGSNWVPTAPSSASSVNWGNILGTLSDQTDLQSALDSKAALSHTHVKADITDFNESDYATPADIPTHVVNTTGLTIRSTSDITTGYKALGRSFQGTVVAYRIDSYDSSNAPVSGSIQIKVYKNTTLIGTATLSSASSVYDSTLSGWTTSLSSDDKIEYEVFSCSGVSNVTLTLYVNSSLV